jgi:hypothetical protein
VMRQARHWQLQQPEEERCCKRRLVLPDRRQARLAWLSVITIARG